MRIIEEKTIDRNKKTKNKMIRNASKSVMSRLGESRKIKESKDSNWIKVRAYNIDYDITEEDIKDIVDDDFDFSDQRAIDRFIKETKKELPQDIIVYINKDYADEEEDAVADAITEKTAYLINSCDYDILNESFSRKSNKGFKKINEDYNNHELNIHDIFLLSAEEYEEYKKRIPHITAWWWLRSPGSSYDVAANVNTSGSVNNRGINVNYSDGAVRPALRILNLKSFNIRIGSSIEIFNRDWVVLDKYLVIAKEPISKHKFDMGYNNYDKSDIKQYLRNWLENQEAKYGTTFDVEYDKDEINDYVEDELHDFLHKIASKFDISAAEAATLLRNHL